MQKFNSKLPYKQLIYPYNTYIVISFITLLIKSESVIKIQHNSQLITKLSYFTLNSIGRLDAFIEGISDAKVAIITTVIITNTKSSIFIFTG